MSLGALACALLLLLLPGLDRTLLVRFGIGAFFAFLIAGVVLILTGLYVRCPVCSELALLNSWVPPHPGAKKGRFVGYKVVIFDVLKRDEFTCYHCGRLIRLAGDQ